MYSSNVAAIQTLVKKRITPNLEKHLKSVSAGFESRQLYVRAVVRDGIDQAVDSELKAMAAAIRDDLDHVFSDEWAVRVEVISTSLEHDQKPLEIGIH